MEEQEHKRRQLRRSQMIFHRMPSQEQTSTVRRQKATDRATSPGSKMKRCHRTASWMTKREIALSARALKRTMHPLTRNQTRRQRIWSPQER